MSANSPLAPEERTIGRHLFENWTTGRKMPGFIIIIVVLACVLLPLGALRIAAKVIGATVAYAPDPTVQETVTTTREMPPRQSIERFARDFAMRSEIWTWQTVGGYGEALSDYIDPTQFGAVKDQYVKLGEEATRNRRSQSVILLGANASTMNPTRIRVDVALHRLLFVATRDGLTFARSEDVVISYTFVLDRSTAMNVDGLLLKERIEMPVKQWKEKKLPAFWEPSTGRGDSKGDKA